MLIVFEDRPSDAPVVERVWRSHSERAGMFRSIAACNWEMVVTRLGGRTCLTVRGPESRVSAALCPPDGEWVGIRFRVGTFMPILRPGAVRDRNDIVLPDDGGRSFRLDGAAWEYPTYENAETFVARLVREGLVAADPLVGDSLQGGPQERSARTEQRRTLRVTGLTRGAIRQIERARHAAVLLRQGKSILDVTYAAGYFDQAHLTRSMRRFVGLTPAQIARGDEQLSLLYKTEFGPVATF